MNENNAKSQLNTSSKDANSNQNISPKTAIQCALEVFDSLGLIRPTAELLFKKLMRDSPEAVLDLLNRIIKPPRPFIEIECYNRDVVPNEDGENEVRSDFFVRSEDGTVVNIVLQSGSAKRIQRLAMYYAADFVFEFAEAKKRHDALPERIFIFLIEGKYFGDETPAHQEFEIYQTLGDGAAQETRKLHPSTPMFHFVELRKLVSNRTTEESTFNGWIDFLLPQSVADWEQIAGQPAMFSELKKKVEHYSADKELVRQQRAIDNSRIARAHQISTE